MTLDLALHAGLLASAFLSATLLPGSSEAALISLLALGRGEPVILVLVATVGNVAGSVVNWALGRFLAQLRNSRWFSVDRQSYQTAARWYARYGSWSLMFAWVPVLGDPLTVIAGVMQVSLKWFLLLVSLGKAARYLAIAGLFAWWPT